MSNLTLATATLPGRLKHMREAVAEVLEAANFHNGNFTADSVSSTANFTLVVGGFDYDA